jgi:hypothetical protein
MSSESSDVFDVAPLSEQCGIGIHDLVEDARVELYTDRAVEPTPASTEPFLFPITTAVEFVTSEIEFSRPLELHVRDRGRRDVVASNATRDCQVEAGAYQIGVVDLPILTYFWVESSLTIEPGECGTTLSFPEDKRVVLGIRSYHSQPAGTVETTTEPADLARAVSTFGGALKTHSPERAWPTLRGHPPLLEEADVLSIPDAISAPETGVRIEVPPRQSAICHVTPLAYYLAGTVEIGARPRLVAGEHSIPLETERVDFETRVDRVLRQQLFCDCLVRTEGIYQYDLHERHALEGEIDLDFERLYDSPLVDRIVAYDAVPFEAVEPQLPNLGVTADVDPQTAVPEYLPFLADWLAEVRMPTETTVETVPSSPAVTDFYRSEQFPATSIPAEQDCFELRSADAMIRAWIGDDHPHSAVKPDLNALKREFTERTTTAGECTVQIVCNDEEMSDEVTKNPYGLRDLVDFEVAVSTDCSTDELRRLLRQDTDFFHYIGHVDSGFECHDGSFDARTLDSTGVETFLLNACTSYRQGEALVETGAHGGIVSLSTVFNGQATEVGRVVAHLLNRGWPLDATFSMLERGPLASERYGVVGDHRAEICHSESLTNGVLDITRETNEYEVEYYGLNHDVGSVHRPWLDNCSEYYLTSGYTDTWTVDRETVAEFMERTESTPAILDGEFRILEADSFPPEA